MPNPLIPIFPIRLLVPQKVDSIDFDSERLQVSAGLASQTFPLDSVSLGKSSSWLGLCKITLTTPRGSYALAGISNKKAGSFVVACALATRRYNFHKTFLQHSACLNEAHDCWTHMVSDERYISNSELDGWLKKFSGLDLWTAADPELLSSLSQAEQTVLNTLRSIRGSERVLISKRNDEFAQREYERNHEFFATIEKNPLTDQQREAVVHDEDNSLVIAGAGSGKTSTIIAKVGYLLKRGLATPDQILLLAFTKKAADEMRDRLKKHFPTPIEVRTFHALGKEIIKRSTGKETSLSKSASDDSEKLVVIATIVKQLSVDPAYLTKLGQFIGSLDKEYRPIWDFKTERDYKNYLQEVEPRTLTGCLTQSYDECEIANWLMT